MKLFESTEAQIEAGRTLSLLLSSHKNQPALLMLSGGSALPMLDFVSKTALSTNLTLTTLDERFSTDPLINNFLQLTHTSFYKHCVNQGASILSTVPEENETLLEMNIRTENALKAWRASNPEGVIIATMGIGIDGHTAGIFNEVYDEKKYNPSWVIGYIVPKNISVYQERITVTKTFLKTQVDHAIVFAAGQAKRKLLKELQTNTISKQMPMNILTLMKDVSIHIEP